MFLILQENHLALDIHKYREIIDKMQLSFIYFQPLGKSQPKHILSTSPRFFIIIYRGHAYIRNTPHKIMGVKVWILWKSIDWHSLSFVTEGDGIVRVQATICSPNWLNVAQKRLLWWILKHTLVSYNIKDYFMDLNGLVLCNY